MKEDLPPFPIQRGAFDLQGTGVSSGHAEKLRILRSSGTAQFLPKNGADRFAVPQGVLAYDCPGENRPMLPRAQLQPHYATIGECLSVAEASSLQVGIPYLVPSAHLHALRLKRHGVLGDFVRSSLVTVPTWAICSYVDDLLLSDYSSPLSRDLGIFCPSTIERYGLLLAAVLLGLACCVILVMSGESSWLAILQSVVLWSVLALATVPFTHDAFRRWTFVRLLCSEINRRDGHQSGASALPLTPA
jgi:hypothetical protein